MQLHLRQRQDDDDHRVHAPRHRPRHRDPRRRLRRAPRAHRRRERGLGGRDAACVAWLF